MRIKGIGEYTLVVDDEAKTIEVRVRSESEEMADEFEVVEYILQLIDEGYKLKKEQQNDE